MYIFRKRWLTGFAADLQILPDLLLIHASCPAERQIAKLVADLVNRLIQLRASFRRHRCKQVRLGVFCKFATPHAQQSHAGSRVFNEPVIQQPGRRLVDRVRAIGRRSQRALPRESRKIGLPDLDLNRPRNEFFGPQAAGRTFGKSQSMPMHCLTFMQIAVKRFFCAD